MTLAFAQDLDRHQADAADTWKCVDVATVNGNAVRFRVMQDVTAKRHVHTRNDEFF
jgi:hypothetical protein